MPLVTPFETSFGRIHSRDCLLLEAQAGGLIGFGECAADYSPGYSYETAGTAWHILEDFILPAILGQEIHDAQDLHRRMQPVRGHSMAKAGIEMALWDLIGKQQNKSLQQLFGGLQKTVKVGVSIGIQETPHKLLMVVDGYLKQGYGRIKLKIKPGQDVEETRIVRKGHPDLPLQVDANSAYTLKTATSLADLDILDLLLIEQPLSEDDLWDHSRLQSMFATPICLDESITSPRHARQAIEMDACRVINIKPGRVGGLSQGIAIHDLCLARDIPVWCGGMLETGVGRAANLALASLPGFLLPGDISASNRYYTQDITNETFMLNPDSTITVPSSPGLGVTVDPDALTKFTLRKTTITNQK